MIVIPMAGNSSRFYRAGYTRPKYELPVGDATLFAICVSSFQSSFDSEMFLFICRDGVDADLFVARECARLGIRDYQCVVLPEVTRGQAETVLLGLEMAGVAPDESLLVFNIDTARPGYAFPAECRESDGYLEVFAGEGEHWSFVKPVSPQSRQVAETSEKKRISSLCCTGLYYFARAGDFMRICREAIGDIDNFRRLWGELYIAPMYNSFIQSGAVVTYHEVGVDEVLFSGTPDEYAALLESLKSAP